MNERKSAAKLDASESDAITATPQDGERFLSADEVLQRLPIGRGTLRVWCQAGKVPFIRLTGRRLLFHWPSVQESLLRQQRGNA
jgi:hypothetical protein